MHSANSSRVLDFVGEMARGTQTEACSNPNRSRASQLRRNASPALPSPKAPSSPNSAITDVDMTQALHERLRDKQLLPDQHIVDTGYRSSAWLVDTLEGFGVRLVGPPPTNRSWQARAGRGFDSSAFHIDWAARQVVCPLGKTSVTWHEVKKRGNAFCTASFAFADCFSCRNRVYCTRTVRHPRQLTFCRAISARRCTRLEGKSGRRCGRMLTRNERGSKGRFRKRCDATGCVARGIAG
jgi:hypothetical protein